MTETRSAAPRRLRWLAGLLCALLAVGMMPQAVGATGEDETAEQEAAESIEVPEEYIAAIITDLLKRREIEIPREIEITEEGDRVARICLFGFGSCDNVAVQGGYRDCDGNFVNKVGINPNVEGTGYGSIHVKPSWTARLSVLSIAVGPGAFASATTQTAWTMYNQIRDCLEEENLLNDTNVRSWTGIWQQLHCHIVYNLLGGGSTWDLEGYRPSNWVGYLNPAEKCNWS